MRNVIVLFGILSISAFGKPPWEHGALDYPDVSDIFIRPGCKVLVHRDHRGVTVTASVLDSSSKILWQSFIIRKESEYDLPKKEPRTFVMRNGHLRLVMGLDEIQKDQDIFTKSCAEAALKLPFHTRQLFFGFYGIH